jgi:hypothetical protein
LPVQKSFVSLPGEKLLSSEYRLIVLLLARKVNYLKEADYVLSKLWYAEPARRRKLCELQKVVAQTGIPE